MGLFGNKTQSELTDKPKTEKEIYKERLKEAGKPLAVGVGDYLGGHININSQCVGTIYATKDGLFFDCALPFRYLVIPIENLIKAEFKTEEQISKDVTLTRLVLLGVFAFGMKKKTKEINHFLTVTYTENGVEQTVIFKCTQSGVLATAINKVKGDYNLANPVQKQDNIIVDIPEQIMKLKQLEEKGILSQEEFETKKKELLSRM